MEALRRCAKNNDAGGKGDDGDGDRSSDRNRDDGAGTEPHGSCPPCLFDEVYDEVVDILAMLNLNNFQVRAHACLRVS